eukprot:TRINITY_DN40517_c0_g1_i1.p1 TRINITY_DN40517_c0_g1~~TRINITY_DN40517_c0_g1_i1.p1  ORF type:complete len:185 (+),score=15.01 TRINITY_DN40517_c0_g1_i1:44-556(+)
MWGITYATFSFFMDLLFIACVVWKVAVRGWLFYIKWCSKLVLLVALVWRFSSRISEAWVVLVAVSPIASMLLTSTICRLTPAQEAMIAFWVSLIVDVPVTTMCWVKLSIHDANRQVAPLPSLGASKLASRTCTAVEVCGSCDDARGIENDATCSICLERIELDELVTQLA